MAVIVTVLIFLGLSGVSYIFSSNLVVSPAPSLGTSVTHSIESSNRIIKLITTPSRLVILDHGSDNYQVNVVNYQFETVWKFNLSYPVMNRYDFKLEVLSPTMVGLYVHSLADDSSFYSLDVYLLDVENQLAQLFHLNIPSLFDHLFLPYGLYLPESGQFQLYLHGFDYDLTPIHQKEYRLLHYIVDLRSSQVSTYLSGIFATFSQSSRFYFVALMSKPSLQLVMQVLDGIHRRIRYYQFTPGSNGTEPSFSVSLTQPCICKFMITQQGNPYFYYLDSLDLHVVGNSIAGDWQSPFMITPGPADLEQKSMIISATSGTIAPTEQIKNSSLLLIRGTILPNRIDMNEIQLPEIIVRQVYDLILFNSGIIVLLQRSTGEDQILMLQSPNPVVQLVLANFLPQNLFIAVIMGLCYLIYQIRAKDGTTKAELYPVE